MGHLQLDSYVDLTLGNKIYFVPRRSSLFHVVFSKGPKSENESYSPQTCRDSKAGFLVSSSINNSVIALVIFFIVTVKEPLSTYRSIIQDRRREENLIFITTAEEDC